nr:CHRD domain-containing protein [Sphingomonas sp. BIUV-7]
MLPVLLVISSPARSAVFVYTTTLSGAAESPPNSSAGTGTGYVVYDDLAHTLQVQISFNGLTGQTTAAHIHSATAIAGAGTAGVATATPSFPGFPLGVTSGSYNQLFDLTLASSYSQAFVTASGSIASAETSLISGMDAGKAYLNVHTTASPGGEIRGFLALQSAVPEPMTWGMFVSGFGLIGAAMRRRHQGSIRFA